MPLQAEPIQPVADLLQGGAACPDDAAGKHRQEAPDALDVKPGFAARRRHMQLSGKTSWLMTGSGVEPGMVLPRVDGSVVSDNHTRAILAVHTSSGAASMQASEAGPTSAASPPTSSTRCSQVASTWPGEAAPKPCAQVKITAKDRPPVGPLPQLLQQVVHLRDVVVAAATPPSLDEAQACRPAGTPSGCLPVVAITLPGGEQCRRAGRHRVHQCASLQLLQPRESLTQPMPAGRWTGLWRLLASCLPCQVKKKRRPPGWALTSAMSVNLALVDAAHLMGACS